MPKRRWEKSRRHIICHEHDVNLIHRCPEHDKTHMLLMRQLYSECNIWSPYFTKTPPIWYRPWRLTTTLQRTAPDDSIMYLELSSWIADPLAWYTIENSSAKFSRHFDEISEEDTIKTVVMPWHSHLTFFQFNSIYIWYFIPFFDIFVSKLYNICQMKWIK